MPWIYIILFIGSCFLLVKAGAWVVRSLVRIAQDLEWSEFFVAFILMSFTTTLPELFVGITSAFHGRPGLAFGNVIGANVIDLTLVVGIAAILGSEIIIRRAIVKKDAPWTVLFACLPILMIVDGTLSRIDGVSLLLGLFVYLSFITRGQNKGNKVLASKFNHSKRDFSRFKIFLKNVAVFIGGVVLLLLSSEGIVRSSSAMAELLNIPLIVIGTLIVAIGTTLPEITFAIRAALSKHKEMALGNLMGAVVINSTLVIGLTCIIHPFKVQSFRPLTAGIICAVLAALFFYFFARTDNKISKKEAIFLIELYIIFVIAQFLLK